MKPGREHWNSSIYIVSLAVIASVFFYGSRRILHEWYLYWHWKDYLLFSGSLIAGVLVAGGWTALQYLRFTRSSRLCITFAILVAALPWGEWLRLNFPFSREDWSRQILQQAVFLTVSFFILRRIPSVADWVDRKTVSILARLSCGRLFHLPPIIAFFFCACISLFIFQRTPLVQDSASHLFQAKIFSQLRLFAPAPLPPQFFSYLGDMLVIHNERWFGIYLPGYPLLLAGAMVFGAQWLLSPFLGALTIAIWMQYVRRWHDQRMAALHGFLCVLSPFLFLMNSTIMVHTLELFLATSTLYVCRRETEEDSTFRQIVLFFILFACTITRSFSLFAFLAPVLAHAGLQKIKQRRWMFPVIVSLGIGAGATLVALYQWKTTGSPWMTAYQLEYTTNVYGFGPTYASQIHTPLRGLENVSNNILGLNSWLTGWYGGVLFFFIVFLLFEPGLQLWDTLLLSGCLLLALFYYFFPFQDLVFGPRFYFLMAPVLLFFAARIVFWDHLGGSRKTKRIVTSVLMLSLLSFLPHRLPGFVTKYAFSEGRTRDLVSAIESLGDRKTIVFLESAATQRFVNWNDPFLHKPVILCRDLGEQNRVIQANFPGYQSKYFRLNVEFGKSNLKGGFRLFDAPETAHPGFLSMFQLGLALQSGRDDPDQDFFDICYSGLMVSPNAAAQYDFLSKLAEEPADENRYKRNFRQGIIRLGQTILLPKLAFELAHTDWKQGFQYDPFRQGLEESRILFQSSGEIGKEILNQISKVERRIDQDRDDRFSNEEITRFLDQKLKIIEIR